MAEKVTLNEDYEYIPKLPSILPTFGVIGGVLGHALKNYHYKLPFMYKAARQIPLYVLGGLAMGIVAGQAKESLIRRKLLRVEQYIATHPEDFVETPAKRYKDVLLPWHPVR